MFEITYMYFSSIHVCDPKQTMFFLHLIRYSIQTMDTYVFSKWINVRSDYVVCTSYNLITSTYDIVVEEKHLCLRLAINEGRMELFKRAIE